jgi:hypothetical protein
MGRNIPPLTGTKCWVLWKSSVFWDVTPCKPLKVNRLFGATCRFQLRGRRKSQARNQRGSWWEAEQSPFPNFVLYRKQEEKGRQQVSCRWLARMTELTASAHWLSRTTKRTNRRQGRQNQLELFITTVVVRNSNPTLNIVFIRPPSLRSIPSQFSPVHTDTPYLRISLILPWSTWTKPLAVVYHRCCLKSVRASTWAALCLNKRFWEDLMAYFFDTTRTTLKTTRPTIILFRVYL